MLHGFQALKITKFCIIQQIICIQQRNVSQCHYILLLEPLKILIPRDMNNRLIRLSGLTAYLKGRYFQSP